MTVLREIAEKPGERQGVRGEREDSPSGHPPASDPIPVNREIPNVTRKFIPPSLHIDLSVRGNNKRHTSDLADGHPNAPTLVNHCAISFLGFWNCHGCDVLAPIVDLWSRG